MNHKEVFGLPARPFTGSHLTITATCDNRHILGPCFQEPIVSIRIPGNPIVMLRRVHANDAARILEGLSAGTFPSDLVYAKIEEWDHITAHVRYGQGYPIFGLEHAAILQGPEEDRSAQLRLE